MWRAIDVPLGDALEGTATWLQHPDEGQAIDIGVLPLPSDEVGNAKDLLDKDAHDEHMFLDLGGEVFLPGYPRGLVSAGGLPIWKRASLASSLEFGEGINRFFYVDTATREGMSGAPCLALSNWQHYHRDPETLKMSVVRRPLSWRLLGVYSGRLDPGDSFEAQIGIVWRETLLFEVLDGRTTATVIIA